MNTQTIIDAINHGNIIIYQDTPTQWCIPLGYLKDRRQDTRIERQILITADLPVFRVRVIYADDSSAQFIQEFDSGDIDFDQAMNLAREYLIAP